MAVYWASASGLSLESQAREIECRWRTLCVKRRYGEVERCGSMCWVLRGRMVLIGSGGCRVVWLDWCDAVG